MLFEMLVKLIGLLNCLFEKDFGKAANVSHDFLIITVLNVPVCLWLLVWSLKLDCGRVTVHVCGLRLHYKNVA
jgi:hypothetical protein